MRSSFTIDATKVWQIASVLFIIANVKSVADQIEIHAVNDFFRIFLNLKTL